MNIQYRYECIKMIMEQGSSHNYTIVMQLFSIKQEFDILISAELESLS